MSSLPVTATGALVVSLDFELIWGMRDILAAGIDYHAELNGAPSVIPRLLELFTDFGIAATWATVGLLFAADSSERLLFDPVERPDYQNEALNPYLDPLEGDEASQPLRYASELIRLIAATPGQELASHTYSHFYCLEQGATPSAFAADLQAARQAAQHTDHQLKSLVLPRNQVAPEFLAQLTAHGFTTYRGTQRRWPYLPGSGRQQDLLQRLVRLADSFINLTGHHTIAWPALPDPHTGLVNVPASHFLRPYSRPLRLLEPLRLQRVLGGLEAAARKREIYHLWWHPHNFGTNQRENLELLWRIFERFAELQATTGMQSLTMLSAAQQARELQSIQMNQAP